MPSYVSGTFVIPSNAPCGKYTFNGSGGGLSISVASAAIVNNLNVTSVEPNSWEFQNRDQMYGISIHGDNAFIMGEFIHCSLSKSGYATISETIEGSVMNENLVDGIYFDIPGFSAPGFWNLNVTQLDVTITSENIIELIATYPPMLTIFYHNPEFNEGITVSGELQGLWFTPTMTGWMTNWSETESITCNILPTSEYRANMSVSIPDNTYGQYWKLFLSNRTGLTSIPNVYRIGGPL